MSAYEYFMVTLSIVIGLALSSLVSRGFLLVHQRATVALHWVPAVWAGVILAWIVQFCYVGWVVNGFEDWSFGVFLLLLSALIALYGAAELILPPADDARPDLLAHFDSTGRMALGLLALYFVLCVPMNYFVLGRASPPAEKIQDPVALALQDTKSYLLMELPTELPALKDANPYGPDGSPTAYLHRELADELVRRSQVDAAHVDGGSRVLLLSETPPPLWRPIGAPTPFADTVLEASVLPSLGVVLIGWGAVSRSPRGRAAAAICFLAFSAWIYVGMLWELDVSPYARLAF